MKSAPIHEVRAVLSLAAILAFRMLGLFMIYPVFAIYASQYHHASPTLIGIALGAYGLTQALLQLPSSMLSDKMGRKPIIVAGLVVFFLGSVTCAVTHNIYLLILGRALQGAGAIGSTIMAFAADLTRVENRTKAMAVLGMTIGVSFGAAMVLGPIINGWFQLSGIFWLTAVCSILGIFMLFWVPNPKKLITYHEQSHSIKTLLLTPGLIRINISVMLLHAILTANFLVIPLFLKNFHFEPQTEWQIYLPVLLGAFISVTPILMRTERQHSYKSSMLLGIAAMAIAEISLTISHLSFLTLGFLLYLFFTGFTLLEALLPALIAKLSPAHQKGTAMGIYSSLQFLGIFLGGWLAGLIRSHFDNNKVILACFTVCIIWSFLMLTAKKIPIFKTKTIQLPTMTQQTAQDLANQLQCFPGVIDVQVSIDDCIAYLKVDHKMFDQNALENSGLIVSIS